MSGDKIGVGIIGTGGAGNEGGKAAATSPYMKLVAIAETNDLCRRKKSQEYGVKGYKDYRELLERKDIELIFNATPNFLHARVAIDSLKAGKHVFSEKPMALIPEDSLEMLKAEKESKKLLQINFEMRYSIMSARIKEIIDEGILGEVKNIFFFHCIGGSGFKKVGGWRAKPEKVGGPYLEEHCHRIDLFRYYMEEEIEEVECIPSPDYRGPNGWHWGYKEPTCTLCFFKEGKIANLVTLQHRAAWTVPEERLCPEMGHEFSVSVVGSEGSLKVDFWRKYIQIFRYKGEEGHAELERTENYEGIPGWKLYHNSIGFFQDFSRRIIEGEEPFMSALDSWKTMAAVFACEESMREKKKVKVEKFSKLLKI